MFRAASRSFALGSTRDRAGAVTLVSMLRRILLPVLGLTLLAARPGATWSIVCVNTKTREVGVATATCLTNFNIRTGVPVIYVGEGAAAAQSFLDAFGNNRRRIFGSFRDTEMTPAEILTLLADRDRDHQTRQYGIANFTGDAVTFTGTRAGLAATGVAGSVGDFRYAIQGNVLTGNEVVLAAELAFRAEKGDMGQRLMAAMEGARALGGDGRCSCAPTTPTACGVPPASFTKTAHCGTVLVARVGDANGGCDEVQGCATGAYYLAINVRGNASDPDPVFILQSAYKQWRKRLEGRPDGVLSRYGPMKALPNDGVTERRITVELRDIDERPITHGGALLEIEEIDGLPTNTTVGPVTDLGDGRYQFTVRAGQDVGTDRYFVRVTDVNPADSSDVVRATLYPILALESLETELFTSVESVPAAAGASVDFVLNRPDRPRAPYLLVARLGQAGRLRSGALGSSAVLPIRQRPFFPAGPLWLDARGRAETWLAVPPAVLEPLVGRRIEVTGHVLGGGGLEATDAVALAVTP